jgi:hypothetical protein
MQDDFGLWEVVVSVFWFMLLVAWIWLLITIISDIFRDRELGGVAKALWCIFIIILPWLGVLVYLIARGGSMHERQAQAVAANEAQFRSYVQDVAGGRSVADELKQLAELRDSGAITPEDYEQAKAKILSST